MINAKTRAPSLLGVMPAAPPGRFRPLDPGPSPGSTLPQSAEPAVVLSALAQVLQHLGFVVLIDVLEQDRPPYQINEPHPDDAVTAWADISAVLDATSSVLSEPHTLGVRFEAAGSAVEPQRFTGVLVARRVRGGRITGRDRVTILVLLDQAVNVLALNRLQEELRRTQSYAERLSQAVAGDQELGIALGLLMASQDCTDSEALELLAAEGRRTHRPVGEVAADLVQRGPWPQDDARLPGAREHAGPVAVQVPRLGRTRRAR